MTKRCKFCGREGSRMKEIRNRWTRITESWKCASPVACIRRQDQLGEWHGKRVLYRLDADGTRWAIRKRPNHLPERFVLTMTYRDHRLTSQHASIEDAKKHTDDLIASWTAGSMRRYSEARP